MSWLIANALLALVWALLFGPFTPGNFLIGLVVAYIALRFVTPRSIRPSYFDKIGGGIAFLGYFVAQLVIANIRMVLYTLGPLGRLRPAILAIPLTEGMTDLEITALANVITLTPGTLSLDVADDRKTLFVHFMHVDDKEEAITEIKDGFERRLLALTR